MGVTNLLLQVYFNIEGRVGERLVWLDRVGNTPPWEKDGMQDSQKRKYLY